VILHSVLEVTFIYDTLNPTFFTLHYNSLGLRRRREILLDRFSYRARVMVGLRLRFSQQTSLMFFQINTVILFLTNCMFYFDNIAHRPIDQIA